MSQSLYAELKPCATNQGLYWSAAEGEELLELLCELRSLTSSTRLYNLATDAINRLAPAAKLERIHPHGTDPRAT